MTTGNIKKPRWVLSVRDLTQETAPAPYSFDAPDRTSKRAVLSKRKRQVIDSLAIGPIYCASTVRIGDVIFRLKEEHDLHALTETEEATGRKYYVLPGSVRRINGDVA